MMRSRAGYSFAEVLFAVAVLGIGFIMVAGIFPAAILQTQAAMEETVGTATARNGLEYLKGTEFMNSAGLPYTASGAGSPPNGAFVYSFHDPRIDTNNFGPPIPPTPPADPSAAQLWDSVSKSLIVAGDPRYAIVPLFSRDNGAAFAKLIVFSVRVRDREQFRDGVDNQRPGGVTIPCELEPKPVQVCLEDGTVNNKPDYIWIQTVETTANAQLAGLSLSSRAVEAAAPGAYVVISDDRVSDNTGAPGNDIGKLNGRVYQLGAEIEPAQPSPAPNGVTWRQFELVVGGDMGSLEENIPPDPSFNPTGGNKPAIAFLIGKGYADPANPGGGYSGPVQVVRKYENVVPLN